jgi:glycosyltransferase involved in cell wall biosynthesis
MEAMRYSKYAKRIQLYFAGDGPQSKRYKKKAAKMYKEGVFGYEPDFGFYNHDELRQLAAKADLCPHCAPIEVEGLSIMEAMQQGAVPVIAQGRYSGTSQFALDRRSVFPEQNPEALAHRIDYWLSHPKERWEMGKKYVRHMEEYDIRKSVDQLVQMFQKAIDSKAKKQ